MTGYHYTTQEAYKQIKRFGLYPETLRIHEYDNFRREIPQLQREAIWLWYEKLTKINAWVVTALLAVIHNSFSLVLLKVTYDPEKDAASVIYAGDNTIKLKCSFGANSLSTGLLPMELLINPILPENIELIWEGDLLSPLTKGMQ